VTEDDIRAVLADEAANAVPGSVVIDRLRAPRGRRGAMAALVAAGVIAVVGAVVVPLAAGREPAAPPAAPVQAGPTNVVVIGEAGGLADTVMLARVDGGRVSAVSLPRDTWVELPGREPAKLNSVLQTDGPAALAEVVGEITGQPVDHWAEVDMSGFEELSAAVGGVEVCLRNPVSDRFSGIDFAAGTIVLRGPTALSFIRQRHGLPNGDLDRMVRQQVFLRALVDKLVTTVLTDPGRKDELSRLVRELVRTDPGWNPVAVAATATGPARLATVPIEQVDKIVDGRPVVALDLDEVRRFTAGHFAPPTGGGSGTSPAPGPGGDGCVN
jgi:LCP family protein required for cell wall assembly